MSFLSFYLTQYLGSDFIIFYSFSRRNRVHICKIEFIFKLCIMTGWVDLNTPSLRLTFHPEYSSIFPTSSWSLKKKNCYVIIPHTLHLQRIFSHISKTKILSVNVLSNLSICMGLLCYSLNSFY